MCGLTGLCVMALLVAVPILDLAHFFSLSSPSLRFSPSPPPSLIGVYQMTPLVRKVYAAAILVTVLGQERGLVPSEYFPNPLFP